MQKAKAKLQQYRDINNIINNAQNFNQINITNSNISLTNNITIRDIKINNSLNINNKAEIRVVEVFSQEVVGIKITNANETDW